jgi:hypothetical protein
MQWSDIPFNAPSRTLRQFALLWLAFFGGWAAWQTWGRDRVGLGVALAALALVVGLLGLVRPQRIRPIFVGWMVLAFPIGWTVSRIVLALVFHGLFTPLGMLFRLAGRDLLALRRQNVTSYWTEREETADVRRYFRQY